MSLPARHDKRKRKPHRDLGTAGLQVSNTQRVITLTQEDAMHATTDATATVRALIAAIPEQCLLDLCLHLALNSLAPPPATSPVEPSVQRRRGRPPGTATNGRRRRTGDQSIPNSPPAASATRPSAQPHDEPLKPLKLLRPHSPPRATATAKTRPSPHTRSGNAANKWSQQHHGASPCASSESDMLSPSRAFRARTLPPRMGPMALSKFLNL
jgi:hypothetical protein